MLDYCCTGDADQERVATETVPGQTCHLRLTDHFAFQQLGVTTVLTQSGAVVKAVATVADALELMRLKELDLLISDIEMPNDDGYSLIRKVRVLEEGRNKKIPAIALTAHARASDRLQALSAGFQLHMPKPVEPAELVMAIANLTH